MTPAALPALWFDGRSARARECLIEWQAAALLLHSPGAESRRYAAAAVVWPEHTRHGQRQLLLPDGGVVQVADARAWDAWAQAAGITQPLAARWAMSWRGVLAAMALLVAVGLGAWRWGIPLSAEYLARWVPQRVHDSVGRLVMNDLERRGWLQPSELPLVMQERITDAVGQMAGTAFPADSMPNYRLNLRKGPRWLGPNAFALPGGDIIVTDALVDLLQPDYHAVRPALLGVVAHELGHVRENHGLRLVFEAGATSALFGWWIGDYSSLLANAPALALQAGYSREHERAADAESLRIMQANRIDPIAMVEFFAALKKQLPERDGDAPAFGLSSHPTDSERIRRFQEASAQRAGH